MPWSFFDRYGQLRRAAPGLTSVVNPLCKMYSTVATSLVNNALTVIPLANTLYDTDSMADAGNSRIRITHAGKYLFTGYYCVTGNATGYRYMCMRKNGTQSIDLSLVAVNSAAQDTRLNASTLVDCAAGDYFELMGLQNSGGGLALLANAQLESGVAVTAWLSAEKVDGAVASYAPSPGPITASALSGGPPLAPVDGQIWIALAVDANGTCWQFRYNAGSASPYKWEFIGGSAVISPSASGNTSGTQNVALTGGGSMTMARAGEYHVRFGGITQNTGSWAAVYTGAFYLYVDAANTGLHADSYIGGSFLGGSIAFEAPGVTVTAGQVFNLHGSASAPGGTIPTNFNSGFVAVIPRRIS